MASISGTGSWLKIGQAAELLGVSDQTVRNWCQDGILTYRRTVGGQRQIEKRSVERALGMDTAEETAEGSTVIYARVSTSHQKADGNLDRQVERLVQFCGAEYGLSQDGLPSSRSMAAA